MKLESYTFKTIESACITEEEGGKKFKAWCGGCGIAPSRATIQEARQDIYDHSRRRMLSKIVEHREALEALQKEANILGHDDAFKLGRFFQL